MNTRTNLMLAALLMVPVSTRAQQFDQQTRPVTELRNPEQMQAMLNALLIPPPDTLSAVRILDLTGNGFGPDDIVMLEPQGRAYVLDSFVPSSVREMMANWTVEADYRHEAASGMGAQEVLSAHLNEDAPSAIVGACIDAVEAHYGKGELDMRLSRDSTSVRVEMWGYDPVLMEYRAPTGEALCRLDPQRFEFVAPVTVTAFPGDGGCVEAWQNNGKVETRPCGK